LDFDFVGDVLKCNVDAVLGFVEDGGGCLRVWGVLSGLLSVSYHNDYEP
jgi:hypothetical protein